MSAPAPVQARQQRAVIYVVLSSDSAQAKALVDRLRAFARVQGLDLLGTYREARDDYWKRPRLKRLLSRAATKALDVVVVPTLDDLAHTRPVVAAVLTELERNGVAVVSAAGETPSVTWLAGARDVHSARIREALQDKRARGERVGGIPYGHLLDDDQVHLVPSLHEQAMIALAIEHHADGASERGIALALDRSGYRSRSGKRLDKTQVRRILRRRGR